VRFTNLRTSDKNAAFGKSDSVDTRCCVVFGWADCVCCVWVDLRSLHKYLYLVVPFGNEHAHQNARVVPTIQARENLPMASAISPTWQHPRGNSSSLQVAAHECPSACWWQGGAINAHEYPSVYWWQGVELAVPPVRKCSVQRLETFWGRGSKHGTIRDGTYRNSSGGLPQTQPSCR
jgi:hypothetical protein